MLVSWALLHLPRHPPYMDFVALCMTFVPFIITMLEVTYKGIPTICF